MEKKIVPMEAMKNNLCVKTYQLCPSLYNSPRITILCKNDGSLVPCDQAINNTILGYKCAPNYESPHGRPKSSTCNDGSWDYTPECIPVLVPNKCLTPVQPTHGEWIYLSSGQKGSSNSWVDVNSVIRYTCENGYKLSATIEESLPVLCLPSGEWSVRVQPTCQRLCASLYNTSVITVSCKNDGSLVSCDKATDNTIRTFRCGPNYEPPHGSPKSSTCYDGSWDNTHECIPVSHVTINPPDPRRKAMKKTCTTPDHPLHGEWIYLSNGKKGYPNSPTDANSVITFSCDSGYHLSATVKASFPVLCLPSGEWTVTVQPTCQKLCPSLYNSPLMTLTCKNDDSKVSCDKATDFTIVTYKCAPYYEPPHGRPKSSTCYNGSWDYTPDCIPVCGEKIVSATPLIVNGNGVERGHYPWALALYSSKDTDPFFTNIICGASLITTRIVLTAAHCVTKKENGAVYKAKYFRVAAGKFYNLYDDPRDRDSAQYAEVELIETHKEYRGEVQNFRGDIALLKLKTSLVLSKVVQPVCYNNLPPVEPNTIGLVTGWGYTTSSGEPSETIKELELPYNEIEQCLKDLDEDFSLKYFISDKFCAGFNDQNTSVCRGDSGGGLVFRNPDYKRRYFIHGIVSLGHSYTENQQVHCNTQRSALFTKVETYIEWIQLNVRQCNQIDDIARMHCLCFCLKFF